MTPSCEHPFLTERHSLPPPLTMPSGWFPDSAGDSSDSNPAPLLRILASSVRRWQSWCASLRNSHCPFTYSPQTHSQPRWSCGRELQRGTPGKCFHRLPQPRCPLWVSVSTPARDCPQDSAPEPALEAPGPAPQGMLGVEVTRLPGLQGLLAGCVCRDAGRPSCRSSVLGESFLAS